MTLGDTITQRLVIVAVIAPIAMTALGAAIEIVRWLRILPRVNWTISSQMLSGMGFAIGVSLVLGVLSIPFMLILCFTQLRWSMLIVYGIAFCYAAYRIWMHRFGVTTHIIVFPEAAAIVIAMAVLIGVPAAISTRMRGEKSEDDKCPACGYKIAPGVSERCSECGHHLHR